MDANEYIEDFESFLGLLVEENKLESWYKFDDKNYALNIIKPLDNITLTLNLFEDG